MKALIVVNPISGGKDKSFAIDLLKNKLRKDIVAEFLFWNKQEDRLAIITRIKTGDEQLVIAAGGDGTINQVAQAVVNSGKTLGIIPLGSGNGLARHLQIPLNVTKAIELINDLTSKKIDTCTINGIFFMCTAGIGFDAHIGKLFAEAKTRGLKTYVKLIAQELFSYKPQEYILHSDGDTRKVSAFLITIANASQYGNNAFVAPQAVIDDGKLDICVLKPFKWWNIPSLIIRVFNKTFNTSKFVETFTTTKISITRHTAGAIHFDGEPGFAEKEITCEVNHKSINVITGFI
ncbi:MAG: diacylglycerol kinase family lipid kinase [Bacteroidetes bacterium]|nr:diacylglycerol kinase family lipid kinase [Bacteroidota bacterium]